MIAGRQPTEDPGVGRCHFGRPLSNATSTTALKPIQVPRGSRFPFSSTCSQINAAVLFVRIFVGVPAGARICSGLIGASSVFIQESLIRTRSGANTVRSRGSIASQSSIHSAARLTLVSKTGQVPFRLSRGISLVRFPRNQDLPRTSGLQRATDHVCL